MTAWSTFPKISSIFMLSIYIYIYIVVHEGVDYEVCVGSKVVKQR